ncbi:hypothetical protein IT418_01865 [bacterium]|nr:hypothetical protein [bacterium]
MLRSNIEQTKDIIPKKKRKLLPFVIVIVLILLVIPTKIYISRESIRLKYIKKNSNSLGKTTTTAIPTEKQDKIEDESGTSYKNTGIMKFDDIVICDVFTKSATDKDLVDKTDLVTQEDGSIYYLNYETVGDNFSLCKKEILPPNEEFDHTSWFPIEYYSASNTLLLSTKENDISYLYSVNHRELYQPKLPNILPKDAGAHWSNILYHDTSENLTYILYYPAIYGGCGVDSDECENKLNLDLKELTSNVGMYVVRSDGMQAKVRDPQPFGGALEMSVEYSDEKNKNVKYLEINQISDTSKNLVKLDVAKIFKK